MKKRNEKKGCNDCINNEPETGCSDNLRGFVDRYNSGMCLDRSYKYYANRSQCERLLKLWGDANGSIAEWRENDRIVSWRYREDCGDCIGHRKCTTWVKECGDNTGTCCRGKEWEPHFFSNKTQTESLLKYHDEKYGTIQGRLAKEEDVDDFDFRVGDAVYSLSKGNGVIHERDDKKAPYGLLVKFGVGPGCYIRCLDGKADPISKFRDLYHGHNLPVTVEEEMPVRAVEKWLVAWVQDGREISKIFKTKELAGKIASGCDHLILGPYSVQIPE